MKWAKTIGLMVAYAMFVVAFHGLGHFYFGKPTSFEDAGVNGAGLSVAIAGAILGYIIARYGDKVKNLVK